MFEGKKAIEAVLDIYFKMVNEADHTKIPFLKINNVWKVIAKSFDSRPFEG